MRGKIRSLKDVITMEETDIVLLTETKGPPPALDGYTWVSKERKNGKGGGVAIATKNNLTNYINIPDIHENDEVESIWIKIKPPQMKEIYFGCFYGPQEKTDKERVTAQYDHLTTQISMINHKGSVILAGDFNAKLKYSDNQHTQLTSRNGKIMENLMDQTKMEPVNDKSSTGRWTRVNRHRPSEKSVIDYIIANQEGRERIFEVEIDEVGNKRLKNAQKESDHNTITAKVRMQHLPGRKTTIKRWKINENTDWKLYNKKLKELTNETDIKYGTLEKAIREALTRTIGEKTIKVNTKAKPRESEKIKELRRSKREKRSKFQNSQPTERKNALDEYCQAQGELRRAIEDDEKARVKKIIEEISQSKDKNHIWKVRKRLLGKKKSDYDTIDENGRHITDPEEAREYIAEYFEKLYQAREANEKGKEANEEILRTNKKTMEKMENESQLDPITKKELEGARRKLKTKKSCGPDNIPNEALINLDKENTEMLRRNLNQILQVDPIPQTWKNGRIITIFKGKGMKGKCSNERGISISSNVGKLFERIINERAKKHLNISDMQGGGKKGANTVDHILALKEASRKGKNIYIAFLDVTKAYDKAWAEGIMFVMEKQGIKDKLWETIKHLNEDLEAYIETKHGNTRQIKLKDNIRQGGVLSVIMYATMMDEIAKEIQKRNLGIDMGTDQKLGCLLWMDDVALISQNKEELQEMLNITEEIGTKYRIKFGEEKSKILKIGNKLQKEEFHIGEMKLGYCDKYKYLGNIISHKNQMDDHITEVKKKTEAALNTAMAIAGSVDLKNIEMESMWKLVESCIIPIISYGWEATIPRKKDQTQIKIIQDSLLKRILMTPKGTPWEPLYIETGLLDPELVNIKNRLNYMQKIKTSNNKIHKWIREDKDTKGWWQTQAKYWKEVEDSKEPNQRRTENTKREIKKYIEKKMMEKIKEGNLKTKTKFYLENKKNLRIGTRARYMDKCNRRTTNIIFKARTRMLQVKENYRNMFQDTICRMCKAEEETQEHVLEKCTDERRKEIGEITKEDIFEEDPNKLRITAGKIERILEKLSAAPLQG